jgi:predicted dehydrogenase
VSRLRVAVVGVGYLGSYHAEKYAVHPDANLVAVVDVDAARARAVAGRLGVEALTDLGALAGRIDCASVAVPTPAHHAVARALLEAGIDVLVEKPITSSVADGQDLLECAAREGRVLQVGHLERFNPAIQAIIDRIHAPRFVESQRLAPFGERGTDVDVILDLMIHDLDLLLATVGSPLRSVDAVGVPVVTDSVDIANARLRFANGCVANVTASRVSAKRERKLRIFQSDAYFSVDFDERRVRVVRREPRLDGPPALEVEETVVERGDALAAEIGAFLGAVRHREPPPVTGWDGLKALEVAEIIRESVETEVRAALAGPTA